MTKIAEVVQYLEQIAPLHLQEGYDNAGLIVGSPEWKVTKAIICLDSTEVVIDEAIDSGANLVIAHHPIIFGGLTKITGANYIQKTIIKAIKNDIAVYAIHTNLDNVHEHGVNEKICKKIGLSNCQILSPKPGESNIGSGMIGELSEPMLTSNFLSHLKTSMSLNVIKHTELLHDKVSKVAVCGGSGSFLTQSAIDQGADVFISADFKYHQFFDANGQIVIIDMGHYESEYFTIELIKELLTDKFTTFAAHCTTVDTNPVLYL
jgi:dinuclear metal center YbgI/SA1388 family protein